MQAETELLALRVWLGVAGPFDIDEWLELYVNTVSDPHSDALELFELPTGQLEPAFMAFALRAFGFEPESERGSRVATTFLAQLCVLQGEVAVPRFCQIISEIDTKYFDPDLRAPPPAGLSELWCGCDWCDDTWTLEHPPGMAQLPHCPRYPSAFPSNGPLYIRISDFSRRSSCSTSFTSPRRRSAVCWRARLARCRASRLVLRREADASNRTPAAPKTVVASRFIVHSSWFAPFAYVQVPNVCGCHNAS